MIKLLLLHGMGGSPEDFRFLLDRYPLARALTLDQSDFSSACEFVGQQIKTFQPHLICGYSMGGRVAVSALGSLARKQELDPAPGGLILISAGLGLKSEEEKLARKAADKRWVDLLERDSEAFWLQWYSQPLFSLGEKAEDAAAWLARRKNSQLTETSRIATHLKQFSPAEHAYLLPDLLTLAHKGISTLYMAGERDKKYADLASELAAQGIPTRVVEDVGHALPLENPQAILDVIAGWEKNWSENGKEY